MTHEEKDIVRWFASGDVRYRTKAEQIYNEYLKKGIYKDHVEASIEFKFLSESFNPVPDLYLRGMYRRQIVMREDNN